MLPLDELDQLILLHLTEREDFDALVALAADALTFERQGLPRLAVLALRQLDFVASLEINGARVDGRRIAEALARKGRFHS